MADLKPPEATILGAGMAGLGAAHRLREAGASSILYERNAYPGGHTYTFRYEGGFMFDDGPHISFTQNERIQNLLAESVGNEYEIVQNQVNNYWRGYWIKHPAQCNLHGLPEDLIVDIIRDFVEAQKVEEPKIENYRDWLHAAFGKTFAETFPTVYGTKYHTTGPENMTTDWLGPRLYRPSLDEVLRGALSPNTADIHYVTHFRYPTHGGFFGFLKGLIEQTPIELSHEVERIDPAKKTLQFVGGEKVPYRKLISSLPLPELIRRIEGVPSEVVAAVGRLACSSCVVVNIAVDRPDLSDAHWTYFYDDDIFFTRTNCPHMLSPNVVPPGAGSFQAEVYYSQKYRPIDREPEECIEPVIEDLLRCGLLREDDEILFKNAFYVPYANVIFDLDRPKALETVHGYLAEIGIEPCGRYGLWGYQWTDESFVSGEEAADSVLNQTAR